MRMRRTYEGSPTGSGISIKRTGRIEIKSMIFIGSTRK